MALRLPSGLISISGLATHRGGAYPPSGFLAFDDHSLGNGDTFGLYWPIGLEHREPLVVETIHDEAALVPAFSNLETFLQLTAGIDEADHADWPSVEDDANSPHACFQAARLALREMAVETAVTLLERAIERLPEYTAALALLVAQYARLGRHADACRLAVRTIRSPPSFGFGGEPAKAWSWISRQEIGPEDVRFDPIWANRVALSKPPSGGTKENPTYPILREAIEVYADQGSVIAAYSLLQSYSEFMRRETTAFQDRYGFNQAFLDRQNELEGMLPSGRRKLA